MMAIRAAYPNYYKNQTEIDDAINLWSEMLIEDDAVFIAKATKEYIKNNSSGFPPTIGQIRTLAKEIRKREWEAKQRENDLLPAPEPNRELMPEHMRQKYQNYLKGKEI